MPRHGPSPSLSTPDKARRKTANARARAVTTRPLATHSNFCVITQVVSPSSSPLDHGGDAGQNGHGIPRRVSGADETSWDRREYRVYNYKHLPSGRVKRGDGWSILYLLGLAGLLWLAWSTPWRWIELERCTPSLAHCLNGIKWLLAFILALVGLILVKAETVLYQSIIIHPSSETLQLVTAHGLSLLNPSSLGRTSTPSSPKRTLFVVRTARQTIPLGDISTVVINEGLSRWSVRYYLAILKRRGGGIVVPFNKVMPSHAVLEEIYHGIRQELFWTRYKGQTTDA